MFRERFLSSSAAVLRSRRPCARGLRCDVALRLAMVVSLVVGCSTSSEDVEVHENPTRNVEVIEVRPTRQSDATQLIGRIEPGQEVTLYFEVVGVVDKVFVDVGETVQQSDPIAQLVLKDYELARSRAAAEYRAAKAEWDLMVAGTRKEDKDLARADYERAKARKAYWQSEFERVRNLVESRAVSESEFQRVAREYDAAIQEELMSKAGLERALAGNRAEEIAAAAAKVEALKQAWILADRQLDKATLRAPFDGRVEHRHVDPGAYINVFPMGGVPVVRLVDLDHVEAVIPVPEAELARFAVGREVEIASAVQSRVRAAGLVFDLAQVADLASGTYDARIRLPNPDGRFTGGMVVVATAIEPSPHESIRVPVTVIRRAYGQLPRVMVVSENGRIAEREVELGPIHGDDVEILNGLAGGELLVVRGQHLVVTGDQVEHEVLNQLPIAQKSGPVP